MLTRSTTRTRLASELNPGGRRSTKPKLDHPTAEADADADAATAASNELSDFVEASCHANLDGADKCLIKKTFSLYDDVIKVVTRYLDLRDLHVSVQLSQQWYRTVRQTKPLGKQISLRIRRPLLDILKAALTPSALACHITDVTMSKRLGSDAAPNFICSTFPNLMKFTTDDDGCGLSRIIRSIDITFLSIQIGMNVPSQLLESSICQMTNLQSLDLFLDQRYLCGDESSMSNRQQLHDLLLRTDFSKLCTLRRLNSLKLLLCLPSSVSHATALDEVFPISLITLVRELPSLLWMLDRSHSIAPWMTDIIHRLVQQPHQLELTEINFGGPHTPPILEALSEIPSITTLFGTPDLPVRRYPLLAKFSNLTDLDLSNSVSHYISAANAVLAVKNCPQVSSLHLSDMRSQELYTILSSLPRLTTLYIENSPCINSLSFVRSHDLPHRLVFLSLKKCGPIPTSEAEHLFQLQQLRAPDPLPPRSVDLEMAYLQQMQQHAHIEMTGLGSMDMDELELRSVPESQMQMMPPSQFMSPPPVHGRMF